MADRGGSIGFDRSEREMTQEVDWMELMSWEEDLVMMICTEE